MKRVGLILWLTLCVMCTGSMAWAQNPGSDKGAAASEVQRLNRAPVNKEVLRVKLPRPREINLANGLTVLVLEQHKLPTVSFTLWVKAGALSDPKELPGLAQATAEMLREGSMRWSGAELAAEIDSMGASLGAWAEFGVDTSGVSASGLVEDAERILELMSDVVQYPTYPAEELSRYQKRKLALLEQERSEPEFLARERFQKVLFGDFAASVVSATPESIKAMNTAQLKQFHDRYYVPNNALLGVAGDVHFDAVVALINKAFGSWRGHSVAPPDLGRISPPAPAKITLVDRPGSVQTNIVAGSFAVKRTDPDFVPLAVMNRVLGGGPSSRLYLNLSEKHGYTYGAYSSVTSDIYPGAWRASTEVRNAVTDASLYELMEEFTRIRTQPVPEAELEQARRSIVAGFALALEHPGRLLNFWMTANYFGLPPDYWDRYPAEVAKVTPEVVERVAAKYVDLDHLQFVCVGDGKQIKDTLKKYGRVESYDVDGKRID